MHWKFHKNMGKVTARYSARSFDSPLGREVFILCTKQVADRKGKRKFDVEWLFCVVFSAFTNTLDSRHSRSSFYIFSSPTSHFLFAAGFIFFAHFPPRSRKLNLARDSCEYSLLRNWTHYPKKTGYVSRFVMIIIMVHGTVAHFWLFLG